MFTFDLPLQIQSLLNQHWLIINYILLFILVSLAYIAYKNPALACGLLIIFFPTYLFRTKIFDIPTTFLELSFLIIFITWLIKNIKKFQVPSHACRQAGSKFQVIIKYPVILLLLASTISIFISPNIISALGIWKAYFIEPALFFLLLINVVKTDEEKNFIFYGLIISALPIALLAIFQKFTGWGIATPQWVEPNARRVTAFFTSPNAVGLYLGPIAVMCLGRLIERLKISAKGGFAPGGKNFRLQNIFISTFFLLSLLAIFFTRSRGAWLGVLAGITFLCFFMINKKWTAVTASAVILILLALPQTRAAIHNVYTQKSASNRIELWKESAKYLAQSPKNFLFGTGLYGFSKIQEQFRNPNIIEPLIYPHNIFLNFWTETGLLGLVAILWILINFFKTGFMGYKPQSTNYKLIIMAAMVAIIIHGFIDVPYFKNDLSMQFWTIAALMYMT